MRKIHDEENIKRFHEVAISNRAVLSSWGLWQQRELVRLFLCSLTPRATLLGHFCTWPVLPALPRVLSTMNLN